jgi:hypothetical protein
MASRLRTTEVISAYNGRVLRACACGDIDRPYPLIDCPGRYPVIDERSDLPCHCGCGITLSITVRSKRIYLNEKHEQRAKDQRRKLRGAGIQP